MLDAKTAAGGAIRSRSAHRRDFTSRSSNTASTTRSASDAAPSVVRGRDASERRVAVLRGEPALRDGPLEVAGDPVAAGDGAREVRLVQRHRACRPPRGPGRCRGPSGRRRRRTPAPRSCARAYAAGIAGGERRRAGPSAATAPERRDGRAQQERAAVAPGRGRCRRRPRARPRTRRRGTRSSCPRRRRARVSATRDTASESSAGNTNATPAAKTAVPHDEADRAREHDGQQPGRTAATASAPPDSLAARPGRAAWRTRSRSPTTIRA